MIIYGPNATYRGRLVAHLANAALDVIALLLAYVRMLRGLLEAEPKPKSVPDEPDKAIKVEGCLPTEMRRQDARHR